MLRAQRSAQELGKFSINERKKQTFMNVFLLKQSQFLKLFYPRFKIFSNETQ